MSDHLFTSPAHWGWLIVFYFFLGGLSAASYFLSALLDLFGQPEDRAAARLGYLVSFPALLLCPPLLILDLDRPERFWHLFWMSQRPGVMFKAWSPMSSGSYGLLAFSAFSFLSFATALAGSSDAPRFGRLGELLRALRRGTPGKVVTTLGAVSGFFVAGYTGVLLSVTNRPIWADTPLLGALFLVSSTTAAAALLAFLAGFDKQTAQASRGFFLRIEKQAALLEALLLAAFLLTQGQLARLWMGPFGLALLAVVVLGLLLPYLLTRRASSESLANAGLAALLSVTSSLGLRAAVVFAAEAVRRA